MSLTRDRAMSNISGRNAVNRFCTSAILLYLSLSVVNTKVTDRIKVAKINSRL